MARKITTEITDDIDGTPGAETFRFGIFGTQYEIDLAHQNLARLEDSLRPFMTNGRKITAPQKTTRRSRSDDLSARKAERAKIVAWAMERELPVPVRGRLPQSLVEQYRSATAS